MGIGRTNAQSSVGYQRPAKWLPIPAFDNTKDEIYILMAVFESDYNPIAFSFAGAYTVDWGDGSDPANFASGATAEHTYNWTDAPESSLFADRGYRQVLIKVSADAGTLTTIDFQKRPTGLANPFCSPILEINGHITSCSSLKVSGESGVRIVNHYMLEKFRLDGTITQTSNAHMFRSCYVLQDLQMNTSSMTNADYFLCYATALRKVNHLDFSHATSLDHTFYAMKSLLNIDIDITSATSLPSTLELCDSLQYAILRNSSGVTSWAFTFRDDTALQYIDINTSGATSVNAMLYGCNSLSSVSISLNNSTNNSNTFTGNNALRNVVLGAPKVSFSLADCYLLSASELNAIFTALPTVTGQTITITNCIGAATCDKTIATAKGWTVQ